MRIDIEERVFHFKQPAGTSRGVYRERKSWILTVGDGRGHVGVGECAPLPDLSCDASPFYMKTLRMFCDMVERTGEIPYEQMRPYPSMLFGLETAFWDLGFGERSEIFSIPINGLVWMGTFEEMYQRIKEKLDGGFHCVKLKIGAIDWERELELIRFIRSQFPKEQIELRVDANGGFSPDEAMERLEQLAQYDIHSIEQPIRQHQWAEMARLCKETPLPIALDEELIGVNLPQMKAALLDTIRPQYIILKPSLHGGMRGCREWIQMARERGIGSWITSALESNIGLYSIAHFCAEVYGPDIKMPQGLGTGMLFTDNVKMPLEVRGERLWVKSEE
ncbi:MAG: o-succinylbenzoate synthase [Prevotella sp.]|nr:o-succinylbenzoate synthase [Prevotella sp.]